MAKNSLSDKLESYRVLIFNSREAQIAPLLAAMGIDADYITTGETLYNETMSLVDVQKAEYQGQSLAYDNFNLEKDDVEESLKRTLKIVKVVTRNDSDLQNRLKFPHSQPRVIEEWINSGIAFCNAVLNEPDLLTSLARFGVTDVRLTEERDAMNNLKALRNNAIVEKGQAQEATRLRNEKLEELVDYCIELRAMAQIALEDQPQLLENLGITVRS